MSFQIYSLVLNIWVTLNRTSKNFEKGTHFLASQDALEVIGVTYSLSHWVTESCFSDFTDVTLVSEDLY